VSNGWTHFYYLIAAAHLWGSRFAS